MEDRNILRNEKGFTLIEIIAVLVILGILAAVAVPRFINLQADARDRAADAAVAEGVAQVNMFAGRHILLNAAVPTTLAQLTTAGLTSPYAPAGTDFSIAFTQTAAGADITVTATGIAGTVVAGTTRTRNVPLPQ